MSNKLIIFTGPSGVGKATIEKWLFHNTDLPLEFSVSATTRDIRDNEQHGVAYYFISKEDFDKKIEENEFIEWNEHFGNKYGTLKSEIQRIKENNKIPLIEVEVIGAELIMNQFSKDEFISIFIEPPSIEDLNNRIKERSTETEEQIKSRIERSNKELSYKDKFDYVVVNDDIERCAREIEDIIRRENGL